MSSRDFRYTPYDWRNEIRRFVIPGFGLMASHGEVFDKAVFGRDTSYMIGLIMHLPDYSDIVDLGIRSLAAYVAEEPQVDNALTDATFPGHGVHETRRLIVHGERVSPEAEQVIADLGAKWGGDANGFTTYMAVDSTALAAIRLVRRARLSSNFRQYLAQRVTHALNGGERTLLDILLLYMRWIVHTIERHPLGLVASRRRSPYGHYFPWRHDDSHAGYLHTEGLFAGQPANGSGPLASSEGQTQAFDALVLASDLLESDFPDLARHWRGLAAELQQNTLKHFWMEERNFFAQAVDRDPVTGEFRQVRNIASNTLEMLNSYFFDRLPKEERRHYLSWMYRTMWYELMTEVGVRSMWLPAQNYLPCFTYWGPPSVWMIDNAIAQMGTLHTGHAIPALAVQHMIRSLNGLNGAELPLESMPVLPTGEVIYDPKGLFSGGKRRLPFLATDYPNGQQGWTSYAIAYMATMLDKLLTGEIPVASEPWLEHLGQEILRSTGRVELIETFSELERVRETSPAVHIDTGTARHIRDEWARFYGVDPHRIDP